MSSIDLTVTNAPNATAYDSSYPTRSTELYCNTVHNILQDMDDAGTWWLTDDYLSSTENIANATYLFTIIQDVFEYAEEAISEHRGTGTVELTAPSLTTLTTPTDQSTHARIDSIRWKTYIECYKLLFLIYYMWQTEEDPLLLKEKLQELLVAWPLQENTIELNSDLGQEFKIYPSWKNADL